MKISSSKKKLNRQSAFYNLQQKNPEQSFLGNYKEMEAERGRELKDILSNLNTMFTQNFSELTKGLEKMLNPFNDILKNIFEETEKIVKNTKPLGEITEKFIEESSSNLSGLKDVEEDDSSNMNTDKKPTKEKNNVDDIVKAAIEKQNASIIDPKFSMKENLKMFGRGSLLKSINLGDLADKKYDEDRNRRQFVQTEREMRPEEFKGKDEKEIKTILEKEYKELNKSVNDITVINTKIDELKKQGFSDEDIEKTEQFKKKNEILEKFLNSNISTFAKFKKSEEGSTETKTKTEVDNVLLLEDLVSKTTKNEEGSTETKTKTEVDNVLLLEDLVSKTTKNEEGSTETKESIDLDNETDLKEQQEQKTILFDIKELLDGDKEVLKRIEEILLRQEEIATNSLNELQQINQNTANCGAIGEGEGDEEGGLDFDFDFRKKKSGGKMGKMGKVSKVGNLLNRGKSFLGMGSNIAEGAAAASKVPGALSKFGNIAGKAALPLAGAVAVAGGIQDLTKGKTVETLGDVVPKDFWGMINPLEWSNRAGMYVGDKANKAMDATSKALGGSGSVGADIYDFYHDTPQSTISKIAGATTAIAGVAGTAEAITKGAIGNTIKTGSLTTFDPKNPNVEYTTDNKIKSSATSLEKTGSIEKTPEEVAKTIGENIVVKVPPPTVMNNSKNEKDKIMMLPFSQRIHNNETSISSYIKTRYLP